MKSAAAEWLNVSAQEEKIAFAQQPSEEI